MVTVIRTTGITPITVPVISGLIGAGAGILRPGGHGGGGGATVVRGAVSTVPFAATIFLSTTITTDMDMVTSHIPEAFMALLPVIRRKRQAP